MYVCNGFAIEIYSFTYLSGTCQRTWRIADDSRLENKSRDIEDD